MSARECDQGAAAPAEAAAAASRLRRIVAAGRRGGPLLVALAACLGLAAGGAAVVERAQPDRVEVDLAAPAIFHSLPEVTVPLTAGNRPRPRSPGGRYVSIALAFEVDGRDLARLRAAEPLLLDIVQAHLRTLTPADLAGEAGAERLRAAIRRIVEPKLAPVRLRAVLFTRLLVS